MLVGWELTCSCHTFLRFFLAGGALSSRTSTDAEGRGMPALFVATSAMTVRVFPRPISSALMPPLQKEWGGC